MRILMVEDSKFFGKLVKKKIQSALNFEVVWAETFAAAQKILESDQDPFFVALLDLNLPDAPQGEIVELVTARKIPTIVFTGAISKKVRHQVWSKKIIDYVLKRDIKDIEYIINLIQRIHNNRSIYIMVVDDSKVSRTMVGNLLKIHQYNLIEAQDGKEALALLHEWPDVKMVISDYYMPGMDGFELTQKIRDRYDMNELAIIGVSGRDDHVIAAQFLKNGANDFISKPFAAEEFYCRVSQNIERIEHIDRRRQVEQELKLAKEEAVTANELKSAFMANMSHEIRTPMNAILGLTHVMLKADLTDTQQDYMENIHGSTQSLLEIVNDILDFSKIEAGLLTLNEETFNLAATTRKLVRLASRKAQQKDIEIIIDNYPEVPDRLVGDQGRLEQILTHLVDNAVKFTDSGEIVVRTELVQVSQTGVASKGARRINSAAEQQLQLRFTVADSGIGMSPAQVENLYGSFHQGDGSVTRRYGGTGLGLTICKRLVEMMGGEISVTSGVNDGSTITFTVWLGSTGPSIEANDFGAEQGRPVGRKVDRNPPDKAPKETERKYPDICGAHVLVVEDNSINQQVVKALLEEIGVGLTMAENGRQAVAAITGEPPAGGPGVAPEFDAVLMDIQMPEMDGYTATNRIRQWELTRPTIARQAVAQNGKMPRRLPIIAMTAHDIAGEKEKCRAAGMDDYLTKPIQPDGLYQTLASWIKRQSSTAPLLKPAGIKSAAGDRLPDSLPGIDMRSALERLGGNHALFRKLMVQFKSQFLGAVATLNGMLQRADVDASERLVHNIKGVAGNMGAQNLYHVCRELEAAFQECDSRQFEPLQLRFETALNEVLVGIDDLAVVDDTATTDHGGKFNSIEIATLINRVYDHLNADELVEDRLLDDLKKAVQGRDDENRAQRLEQLLAQFEYDAALHELKLLADEIESIGPKSA